jgi:hypothetical protein
VSLLAAALLGWSAAGRAQLYEDRMEPADLGIGDLDSLSTPACSYVGPEACRPCHEAAYQKWLGTKHCRTFVQLRSAMAADVAQRRRIAASSPDRSAICLSCHGTAANVPAAFREPGFRIEDGVSCEKCHGPGADHVWATNHDDHGPRRKLARPPEDMCWGCHQPKESHEKLPVRHLTHEQAWARIAHPEDRK